MTITTYRTTQENRLDLFEARSALVLEDLLTLTS